MLCRAFLPAVYLIILATVVAAEATLKKPTTATPSGPAYKPNQPFKDGIICDPVNLRYRSQTVLSSCRDDGYCWKREFVPHNASDLRMVLEGTIMSTDGAAVKGAIFEMWQTDSMGHYGVMSIGVDDGYCRAKVRGNHDGTFKIETDIPGNYGSLVLNVMGMVPRTWETPPFMPAHIHVILWAPGYQMLTTELHFEGDASLQHDWRELVGHKMGTRVEDGLLLTLEPSDGVHPRRARFDFVLEKAGPGTNATQTYDDALYHRMCIEPLVPMGGSWFYCHPLSFQLFRPSALLVPVGLAFGAVAGLRSLRGKPARGKPGKKDA